MLYANEILRENITKILREGYHDGNHEVRPRWPDGSPAHTIYTTAVVNTFDLSEGQFPLSTLRPVAWKTALKEILWIYQDASNDVNLLKSKYGVNYWDSWQNNKGTLGTAYGYQIGKVTKYPEGNFNQMQRVLYLIKNDPMNRRIMTNMIDIDETPDMTLVPCAFMTMWTVEGNTLHMTLIQRSNDLIAAQSINACQYAMLLMMVAATKGYKPGKFTHFIQNMHLYDRHVPIAREMLLRDDPITNPTISLQSKSSFYDYTPEDFTVGSYFPHPKIGPIEIAI